MKKWLAFLLMVIMCFCFSITSCAEDETEYVDDNDYSHELEGLEGTPSLARWTYTSSTSQGLSINSGTATMTASVTGYSDKAVKVVMYMYLQQSTSSGGWRNLASYSDTFNDYYGLTEHYYSTCPRGYTYRLRCSYYVYAADGTYEHIIAYSGTESY